MVLLTTLLLIVSVAVCLMVAFGQRVELSIPMALFLMVLVLYLFGILNLLDVGFYAVIGAALVATSFLALARRNDFSRAVADVVRSPGFVMFVAFAVVSYFVTRDFRLTHYDEFSHWGRVVRAMYLHDALGPFNPVELRFRSYPPGTALFEYLVMRLNGTWHEGVLFWAYQLLCASCFVPFFKGMEWARPRALALASLLVFLMPNLMWGPATVTLADPLLGYVFGMLLAGLLLWDPLDWKTTWFTVLGIAVMLLVKDSGGFLASIVLVAYAARMLQQPDARNAPLAALAHLSLPVLAVVLVNGSWNALLEHQNVELIFHQPIALSSIADLVDGTAPDLWYEVLRTYLQAVFSEPIGGGVGIRLSQSSLMLIAATLLPIAAYLIGRTRDGRPVWTIPLVALAGAVVYGAGLAILYLFRFSEEEALRLAGYVRYAGAYWTGVVVLLTASIMWLLARVGIPGEPSEDSRMKAAHLDIATKRARRATAVLVALWTIVLVILVPLPEIAGAIRAARDESAREQFDAIELQIERSGVGVGDRVLVVIADRERGYEGFVLRYLLLEANVDIVYRSDDRPTADSSSDAVEDITMMTDVPLNAYDYVVLFEVDDEFSDEFGTLFSDPTQIANDSMFAVNRVDGAPVLVRVQ